MGGNAEGLNQTDRSQLENSTESPHQRKRKRRAMTYAVLAVSEQGDAFLYGKAKTEQAAKMARGKAAKKFAHEDFFVMPESAIAECIDGINNGRIQVVNGELVRVEVKPVPKPKLPENIAHMIQRAETPAARESWQRVADKLYAA